MTFLAPGFFLASLAVAAGVIALHFIVTRQPRAGILPTARFVPNLPATATARHTRPSDLLLMLLRVALILAAGAGMARPVFKPSRGAEARIILADVSRSYRDSLVLRDTVRALYRDHDALILFDSSAREITIGAKDSIETLRATSHRGNLGAAMIAAQRAASALRDRADSIELVIVSPFAAEEFDDATSAIRNLWPGRARLVRLAAASDSADRNRTLDVRAAPGDPMIVASTFARRSPNLEALIVRDGSGAEAIDRPVMDWPVNSRPRGAVARPRADVIGGVVAQKQVVIASFERRWIYPADSIRGAAVIARWIDGEPAAVEWESGASCIRSAAIPVSARGDLVLRDDFARFVAALSGECAAKAAHHVAEANVIDQLAGRGPLASRNAFLPREDVRSSAAPWLIAIAIFLAIAELLVRRKRKDIQAEQRRRPMERAA